MTTMTSWWDAVLKDLEENQNSEASCGFRRFIKADAVERARLLDAGDATAQYFLGTTWAPGCDDSPSVRGRLIEIVETTRGVLR